jgi:hypothetical protein
MTLTTLMLREPEMRRLSHRASWSSSGRCFVVWTSTAAHGHGTLAVMPLRNRPAQGTSSMRAAVDELRQRPVSASRNDQLDELRLGSAPLELRPQRIRDRRGVVQLVSQAHEQSLALAPNWFVRASADRRSELVIIERERLPEGDDVHAPFVLGIAARRGLVRWMTISRSPGSTNGWPSMPGPSTPIRDASAWSRARVRKTLGGSRPGAGAIHFSSQRGDIRLVRGSGWEMRGA